MLDGGYLRFLSSPVPPAGEWPVSAPPPQPASLSLPPWLIVLHGHATPLHLPLAQPTTTKESRQNTRKLKNVLMSNPCHCTNIDSSISMFICTLANRFVNTTLAYGVYNKHKKT